MLQTLKRKLITVISDPVLRRWLVGRLVRKWPARPMQQYRPPYLDSLTLDPAAMSTLRLHEPLPDTPTSALELTLSGRSIRLNPGDEVSFVETAFSDPESHLALHRFAWVSHAETLEIALWVRAIFTAWLNKFGRENDGWAWHPYTAAERLINLLAFAKEHGAPGKPEEFLNFLGKHGPAINDHLEYFGPDHTGNHLANNGRGLYLGGLALGLGDWVEIGSEILLDRGAQIFTESGLLKEGSSHYHLLTTRWYCECWLAAERHDRPEAAALKEIAGPALAACQLFDMPGGFPLIGDVSPDCSPAFLMGLLKLDHSGWYETLDRADQAKIKSLAEHLPLPLTNQEDWLRKDLGTWSLLCHNTADGWSYLPGHGHQDFGGFELHHTAMPIFQDLGRRSYGPSGDGDVGAAGHNTMMIDGQGPYPVNRPYYNGAFREQVTGPKPKISIGENHIKLSSNGFSRLKGPTSWQREWVFETDSLSITDTIDGAGRHTIERFFHSTLPVTSSEGEVQVGPLTASLEGQVETTPSQRWGAYGYGEPATSITITNTVELPWSSTLKLELSRD